MCTKQRTFVWRDSGRGDGIECGGGDGRTWYIKLEEKFPNVKNDEMIIMPNHIHFIIKLIQPIRADPSVCPNVDEDITMGIQSKMSGIGIE